MFFKALN